MISQKSSPPKISIVVPMYNEEDNISELYERLKSVMKKLPQLQYEYIFVNDGSIDHTYENLVSLADKDENIIVVNFTRNFGHEAATTAGIVNSNGDAVIIIDADLQDPPELIVDMVKKWEEGYEIIYAKRKSRKGETFLKRMTSKLFYRVFNMLTDTKMPKDTGDFRLIDSKVANDFKKLKEKNRITRALINWIGYNQTHILFDRDKRFSGKTKYNYFKLIRLAIDSITSFSTKPLTFIVFVGLLLSLLSFATGVIFILIKLFTNIPINGWTSTVVLVLFLNGFQIFLLGIVGQYIARISVEVKERPLYLIRNIYSTKNNSLQK